ncbi:hypothetical protein R3P38DRAFT_2935181 [Favolaschia claudopus]|uniref:MYND-type domain-containing protein n=1 Tax=Favolaschia claudopus TaxID=2862362 RepID=A0AAW0BNY7_9AGAR
MAAQPIQDLLWSDDFAVLLGLKHSIYPNRNLPDGQEFTRHERLMVYLHRNAEESEPQQDIINSRFCALYLPATIDKLFNLPVPTDMQTLEEHEMAFTFSAHNAWAEMLVAVQHIPYVGKYLRSNKPIAAPGKQLPQLLADRLADAAPRWEGKMAASRRNVCDEERQHYISAAANAVQVLNTLCTHFIKVKDRETVISRETQGKLLPFFLRWSRRYRGQFLGDVSERMKNFFSNQAERDEEFRIVRRMYRNWDVCGLPTCNERTEKKLKACGRCQTVRYCSSEHQRMDWTNNIAGAPHKQFCHKTEY